MSEASDPICQDEVDAKAWTPPPDVVIPARFVLEVYALDSGRRIVAHASGRYSRAPP